MTSAARIRPLAVDATAEIDLVAERMRLTLVEVEGEAVGGSMYSMDWLRERVRFHLDHDAREAEVFVAELEGAIAGHTIVRTEHDETGRRFGLFSTTYVDPRWRRHGIADQLLARGEVWMRDRALEEACTWTSATNAKLIGLYEKRGYREVERATHEGTGTVMVRLARRLS